MKEQTDHAVYEDEIDLGQIFLVLWQRKWIIFFITCLVVIATIIYTSTLP
ncbi:MAG: LPS O-antigen length regulator, partial [Deltaproteobacteria bacterium]|nr:LPS O-antigen length regulator [Deltaproteobacteria bacterium]